MSEINDNVKILELRKALEHEENLELAVLVGSRAEKRAHQDSDWDVAVQFSRNLSAFDRLSATENIRRKLAGLIGVEEYLVDLIDIPNARLAMRSLIVDVGIPLKGENDLVWNHFLTRTWRELEMYDWEKQHET